MKRGLMFSAFMGDCTDPEMHQKIDLLGKIGIDFISAPLCICRPKFCRYPYVSVIGVNGASSSTYDLMQFDPLFWESFEDKIKLLNQNNIGLQVDLLSAVTFKRDYMCYTHNVQGIKPSMDMATSAPKGIWATVLDNLGKMIVGYLNQLRVRAVMWSLEGGNAYELWLKKRLLYHGLKQDTIWITNSGTKGMINCPHLHSVSAFKDFKRKGGYCSTDGYEPTPKEMAMIVKCGKQYGWAALELWMGCFSDGANASEYRNRTRPSLNYIRQKAGSQIKELCR